MLGVVASAEPRRRPEIHQLDPERRRIRGGSGVQRSMWKWVISPASIVAEVNSIPAKARLVYFFTLSPATCTSSTSAWSQEADQVSTVAFVYASLKSEMTSSAA